MINMKKLATYFRRADFFATDVAFRENGGQSFGSIFGSFLSLLIALVVSSYGISKFIIMINREDTYFNEWIVENELTDDDYS